MGRMKDMKEKVDEQAKATKAPPSPPSREPDKTAEAISTPTLPSANGKTPPLPTETGDTHMSSKSETQTEKPTQPADTKMKLGLTPEVTELVMELRETVKRIDPRKHTPNTLRRALASVKDILDDIEALRQKKD